MEVILLQDVKSLGKAGDTVKVKDGYARNFLIPKKIAMSHTAGAVKVLEESRRKTKAIQEKTKAKFKELADKISKLALNISIESGVDDVLFGSVTTEMIWHAMQQEGIQIDKKSIIIPEAIKKLGVYNITVKLHPEVKQELRIWVVKK